MKAPRKRFKVIASNGNSTPADSLKDGIDICNHLRSGAKVVDQFGNTHYTKQ
jgi:hypothetical protein